MLGLGKFKLYGKVKHKKDKKRKNFRFLRPKKKHKKNKKDKKSKNFRFLRLRKKEKLVKDYIALAWLSAKFEW